MKVQIPVFRIIENCSLRKHLTYIRSCSQTFKNLAPEKAIIFILLDGKQHQNNGIYPMKEYTNIFPGSIANEYP